MEYVLICQSLFVRINCSDELSIVHCSYSLIYYDVVEANTPDATACGSLGTEATRGFVYICEKSDTVPNV